MLHKGHQLFVSNCKLDRKGEAQIYATVLTYAFVTSCMSCSFDFIYNYEK